MSTNNLSLTLPLTPRTLNTPMEDVRHLPQFKTQIHIIFYWENQTLKRHEYFAQKKKNAMNILIWNYQDSGVKIVEVVV